LGWCSTRTFFGLHESDARNYDEIRFLLTYVGRFSWQDTEQMTYLEIGEVFDKLYRQKVKERQAAEQAQAKTQAAK